MDTADLYEWHVRTALQSLESFWCNSGKEASSSHRGHDKLSLTGLALVLDLAAALTGGTDDTDDSATGVCLTHGGSALCGVAAVLTLWLEARVTVSQGDERQMLRAVRHDRRALLWQPPAWIPSGARESDAEATLDRAIVFATRVTSPTPTRTPPSSRGSPLWFACSIKACVQLFPGQVRDENGESLWGVVQEVLHAEAGAEDGQGTLARHASPVVVGRAFLGSLFGVRARAVAGFARWLLWHTARCSTVDSLCAMSAGAGLYARLLVVASDAASIAHEQFATPRLGSLVDAIQAELLAHHAHSHLRASPSTQRRQTGTRWVHPSVRVSGLPCRIVAGIGLVAGDEPIHEGQCVLAELPLASYTRADCASKRPIDLFVTTLRTSAAERAPESRDVPTTACLSTVFGQASVLAADADVYATAATSLTLDGGEREPSEALATSLVTTLTHPSRHLVKPISSIDTFKVGIRCMDEVGVENKHMDAWSHLRAVDAGKCIGYLTGLLNHSCSPNALLLTTHDVSDDTAPCVLAVTALRTIEAGEEITISYLPSPLLSAAEKSDALGFPCGCQFCATRGFLLEGIRCGECHCLLRPAAHGDRTSLGDGGHAPDCPARRTLFSQWRDSLLPPVLTQIALAESSVAGAPAAVPEKGNEDDTVGEEGQDVLAKAVHALVRLDEQLESPDSPFLPIHYVRVRLREHLLALAAVSSDVTRTLSESLQHITAELLESVALVQPANTPLLTDLRMHHVFVRARHLHDTLAADEAAAADPARGHCGDCCGAVREEAMMMHKAYVRDSVVRHCIIRSFQEHHVQMVGWRECAPEWLAPWDPLTSFLARFPVELLAAGVEQVSDMELLACMDDGAPPSDDFTDNAA